jgi:hypothetical protein
LCLQVKKQGALKQFIFNSALRYKQFWMGMGYSTTAASPLCNKAFFSKTQVCSCLGVRFENALRAGHD